MKTVKKTLTLLFAFVLAFSVAACGDKRGPGDEIDVATYDWYAENLYTDPDLPATAVKDSSQIADYTGAHSIDLKAWNTTGAGEELPKKASNDVVSAEIKRITGISIDTENSFGNRGMTPDVRFNNLQSLGQIPDIAYGHGWLDTEEVWDLTDLIDRYCPTIKARMPSYVWESENVNGGKEGKVYAVPYGLQSLSLSLLDPLADDSSCILFSHINEYRPYVVVREDVLKDAYPDALTTADIDRIFKERGKFTEEEIFDIPITSAAQFRTEFLPKIYQTIQNGGDKYKISGDRYIKTIPVTPGSSFDTWDLMGKLIPYLLGAGANSMNTNMSYWDVSEQKIESMLYQDFYKSEVYEWSKMIATHPMFKGALDDMNTQSLAGDINSGYYAVCYLSSSYPTAMSCPWNGGTVRYRKVFMNIPMNEDRFMYCGFGEPTVSSVKFFKENINEDELAQLLRWLDFQCSRTADKLYAWGPNGDDALFTEDEAGNRTYKDADLVNQMVFSTAQMGDKVQRYNLSNGSVYSANAVFPFYYMAGSIYHPKATSDLSGLTGLADTAYSSAVVMSDIVKEKFVGLKLNPSIHNWNNSHLNGVESVWSKRTGIEGQLKQLLISGGSENSFNAAWNTLQNLLNTSGWIKNYFEGTMTNAFLNINKNYTYKFYKGE